MYSPRQCLKANLNAWPSPKLMAWCSTRTLLRVRAKASTSRPVSSLLPSLMTTSSHRYSSSSDSMYRHSTARLVSTMAPSLQAGTTTDTNGRGSPCGPPWLGRSTDRNGVFDAASACVVFIVLSPNQTSSLGGGVGSLVDAAVRRHHLAPWRRAPERPLQAADETDGPQPQAEVQGDEIPRGGRGQTNDGSEGTEAVERQLTEEEPPEERTVDQKQVRREAEQQEPRPEPAQHLVRKVGEGHQPRPRQE